MQQINDIMSIISAMFWCFLMTVVILLPIVLLSKILFDQIESSPKRKPSFTYLPKTHIMTNREENFFKTLCEIFDDKCYIMSQVHLSALLNHKVKGQNWKSAFRHINGKSVDFVLLRRRDLSVLCAVELDDSTHDKQDRIVRDKEVERIFRSVNIPLVRMRSPEHMTKQEIANLFACTINSRS